MTGPSIKGTGFESVVEDVNRLVADGRISPQELEANLSAEERAYLGQRILASSWYPLSSYAKLIGLLVEKEGHGDPEYLVERGRRAAERLYKAGLYRQLDATIERWGERFGSLMSTLGSAMYTQTEWKIAPSPGKDGSRYQIEIKVPAEFPDCCRHTIAGFIEVLGGRASGQRIEVRSHRVSPTRITLETYRR